MRSRARTAASRSTSRRCSGQIAKPVSGPFGTGHVITTKVGTALLTDDGRFAAGAVPEQVLIEALGTK